MSFVVGLGAEEDIDSALRIGGTARWDALRAHAAPWVLYAVQKALEGRAGATEVVGLRRVGALCRAAAQRWPVEVRVALREVARSHQIDERFLLKVLDGPHEKTTSLETVPAGRVPNEHVRN